MITVVVSVYNTGRYLPKAMETLLAQTYRDYEIIIVDDGSNDGSETECERQAEGRENVRVIHKPNGGLSSARNCGIEHARGEYIIFPDPDDWVEPDYLEKLLSIQETLGAELAICGHYLCKGGVETVWAPQAQRTLLNTEDALALLMRPDYFCGYAWNKLYRMDVIRENNLRFDTELGVIEDLHFAVLYLTLCGTIGYDPVPLYHYSRDNGGMTLFRKKLGKRELSGLRTYEKIAQLMHGTHPRIEAAARASLGERSLRFMGIYAQTGMDEPETLAMLKRTFWENRRFFFACKYFTFKHKCAALTATVSPALFNFIIHKMGHMRGEQ